MKTMLFNPYSGNPRHPSDIASDPDGILMLDPDQPLRTAALEQSVHTATRLDLQEAFAAGVSYRPARAQPVQPDKERLDWLEQQSWSAYDLFVLGINWRTPDGNRHGSLRDAVDAARSQS